MTSAFARTSIHFPIDFTLILLFLCVRARLFAKTKLVNCKIILFILRRLQKIHLKVYRGKCELLICKTVLEIVYFVVSSCTPTL